MCVCIGVTVLYLNNFFLLYVSRLNDYASLIRNAVLTTMNETRVSLPHLSCCHEAHRPLLRDIGFKAAVAILACFLEGITIHSHKAALCPFSFHKALVQLYTVWDLILHYVVPACVFVGLDYVSWVNSKTWSAYHVQHLSSYCGKLITLCTHKENTKRLSKYSMRHETHFTVLQFHSTRWSVK